MPRVLIDTNILAYQFDPRDSVKHGAARAVLADGSHEFHISTQVLLELFQVLTRKFDPPVPVPMAQRVLAELSQLPVVAADAHLVLRAAQTAHEVGISIWDAMIVEAAVLAGCDEVWTQDLSHGQTIRGVRIHNPLS